MAGSGTSLLPGKGLGPLSFPGGAAPFAGLASFFGGAAAFPESVERRYACGHVSFFVFFPLKMLREGTHADKFFFFLKVLREGTHADM